MVDSKSALRGLHPALRHTLTGAWLGLLFASSLATANAAAIFSEGRTRNPEAQSGQFISEPSQGRFIEDAPENTPWPPAVDPHPPTSRCSGPLTGSGRTYNVGPGQTYKELTDVPWLSLMAGDVVNIHHRPEPYRTKFGLRAQGTERDPVIINGVTDAMCNRPEISGANAATADDVIQARFGEYIEPLGLIQIHRNPGDNDSTHTARHIRIQNLKLTSAHHKNKFYNRAGIATPWNRFAAAIYAVRVSHLTVENCEITGNDQGVFTNSRGNHPNDYSAYVIIRRNKVHLNGSGNPTEHNLYIQAYRTLIEGNYVGAVASGAGSSIKDRSSGTVIRFNHIVSGARAIDLVETEEEYVKNLQKDPLYHTAWVYGNVIVNDVDNNSFSTRLFHWGFDNSPDRARTGTLYFYNNTVVNRTQSNRAWYVTLFHMNEGVPSSTQVVAQSNIFANYGNSEFQFLTDSGKLIFKGANFVPQGWKLGQPNVKATIVRDGAELISGNSPEISAVTFRPEKGSPVVRSAPAIQLPKMEGVLEEALRPMYEFNANTGWVARKTSSALPSLGALAPQP